ncbi:F0F1 ATP synthase subunit B [Candidatus Saccharibacteria bacterium]|nr:F0F1 ATP synthase subunit B [Candidatus Saccharibacteria bacterium]
MAEASSDSPLAALGVSFKTFIIQLITFVLVFLLLKRFAFGPISRMLAERRRLIDEGVKAGQLLAKEREQFEQEKAAATRQARTEADKIIASAHKEARDVIHEAEKTAARKAEAMLSDAEARIAEQTEHSRRKLEKDLVNLISDATEAIVGEKLDAKKDAALVDHVMKGLTKK